jgi:hypothetical protein
VFVFLFTDAFGMGVLDAKKRQALGQNIGLKKSKPTVGAMRALRANCDR